MIDEYEDTLVVIAPLPWRGRVVGSRRRADAHVLDGRYSSLDGAGRNVHPSSRGVPRPFAFSIPRFPGRSLSGAGVERGTLFVPDWFSRRRFFFLGGNLYGHLPRNRNAMVVDGLGGATRIVGGCRDVLAGPCHQTGKEPAQGKGMQLGSVNVTARLSVTLECTCETDAEQSDAAELWSARNLKSTSTATTR